MSQALVILNELNNDDLNWMVKVGLKKQISPGEILIYEGEQISAIYIILSGSFSVLIKALGGKELARISRGEIIGEISFLDSRPPVATVQALEDSFVLIIPRIELALKLQKSLGFAGRFYRGISLCLANRMHNTISRLGYEIDSDPSKMKYEEVDPSFQENLALNQAKFQWLAMNSTP